MRAQRALISWRVATVLFSVAVLALLGLSGVATAQETGTHDTVYVVAHVDVTPDNTPAATKLLQQYAADSRKEKGAMHVDAVVQASRKNHFTLIEIWQNRQDFDAHLAAMHTKQFREQIHPMLGSPYDERLHSALE